MKCIDKRALRKKNKTKHTNRPQTQTITLQHVLIYAYSAVVLLLTSPADATTTCYVHAAQNSWTSANNSNEDSIPTTAKSGDYVVKTVSVLRNEIIEKATGTNHRLIIPSITPIIYYGTGSQDKIWGRVDVGMPGTTRTATIPSSEAKYTSSGFNAYGKDLNYGFGGTYEINSDICQYGESDLRRALTIEAEWVSTTKLYTADGTLKYEKTNNVSTVSTPSILSKVNATPPSLTVVPTSVTINQNLRQKPTETLITITLKDYSVNNMVELGFSGTLSLGYMLIDKQQLPYNNVILITSDNQKVTGTLTVHNSTAGKGSGYLVITARYA